MLHAFALCKKGYHATFRVRCMPYMCILRYMIIPGKKRRPSIPKPSTWLHMLTEEEEEALQPGLEKSLRCSFPSLRTDVRAAEDWREPGQSWETADLC